MDCGFSTIFRSLDESEYETQGRERLSQRRCRDSRRGRKDGGRAAVVSPAADPGIPPSMATSQLDLEALEAEIGRFLDGVAVAEDTGAKLQRLLRWSARYRLLRFTPCG